MLITPSKLQFILAALCASLVTACATPPSAPPAAPVEPARPAVVLPISQVDRGVQIFLPDSVLFETGSAQLNSIDSSPYLDRIAQLLLTKTDQRVRIEGHTDNTGSAALNQKLSDERAGAIAQSLIQRGVAANRIDRVGLSFSSPLAPNDVEAGRRLNRRAELIILGETVDNLTKGEPSNAFEDAALRIKQAIEQAKR